MKYKISGPYMKRYFVSVDIHGSYRSSFDSLDEAIQHVYKWIAEDKVLKARQLQEEQNKIEIIIGD